MRSLRTKIFGAVLLALVSVGCEPRPVVAPETDSAVDVDVNREGIRVEREGDEDEAAVDVQVGGGQGVQVEVERDGQ